MEKEKKEVKEVKEKKKLSLKDIGLERLVIILLCGIFLIVISFPELAKSKNKDSTKTQNPQSNLSTTVVYSDKVSDTNTYVGQLEKRVETILKKVDGVGDCKVMITLKSSKELITLKDEPFSEEELNESDSQGGSRKQTKKENGESTVMISNENGNNIPYVVKELEPEVEGVVVIAQGGGNINTVTQIVDAIVVLFDVPAHKIKVMKMNS